MYYRRNCFVTDSLVPSSTEGLGTPAVFVVVAVLDVFVSVDLFVFVGIFSCLLVFVYYARLLIFVSFVRSMRRSDVRVYRRGDVYGLVMRDVGRFIRFGMLGAGLEKGLNSRRNDVVDEIARLVVVRGGLFISDIPRRSVAVLNVSNSRTDSRENDPRNEKRFNT